MRCIALGRELKRRDWTVRFLSRDLPGNCNHAILNAGFQFGLLPAGERVSPLNEEQDAADCLRIIEENNWDPSVALVDHYGLGESWQNILRPRAKCLAVIEDRPGTKHSCDILIDQNFSAKQADYAGLPATCRLLLGPQFALLRDEFLEARRARMRIRDRINRVLISFGGTDPTAETIKAVQGAHGYFNGRSEIRVVAPSGLFGIEAVERFSADKPDIKILRESVSMSDEMCAADLAIGAGGITTWERLTLGLPSIVTTVAPNQERAIKALDRAGYVHWMGGSSDTTQEAYADVLGRITQIDLSNMSRSGAELVDARGTSRVADALTQLASGSLPVGGLEPEVVFRDANLDDCITYFLWANDPDVRRNSFNGGTIPLEDHLDWFESRLRSSDTVMRLAEVDGVPVGQIRLERQAFGFLVNFSVAASARGKGLGTKLLTDAVNQVRPRGAAGGTIIRGLVKPDNEKSKKAFQRAGFVYAGETEGYVIYDRTI